MSKLDAPSALTTERLLLRKPVEEDAQPIFDAYASDPDIPRYMTWLAHRDVESTRDFLRFCVSQWNENVNFEYVVERLSHPGTPIGMIGMHPGPGRVGFGYVLARDHWGKGYTSEALKALVDWSLQQDGVHRAQAFCDLENPASARVMEKAGMTYEGILRRYSLHPNLSDIPRDCFMYAKVS